MADEERRDAGRLSAALGLRLHPLAPQLAALASVICAMALCEVSGWVRQSRSAHKHAEARCTCRTCEDLDN